ncbi:MAG TPA: DUF1003 domain-containing protein [Ktedonobacteraceae bacterium]|nr:DUF1003 domain-containing protein [Ktedonobacteraceae bacterium]
MKHMSTPAHTERRKDRRRSTVDMDSRTVMNPIDQNIETIARIHRQMESEINYHQRTIEKVTAFFGRPRFLYIIVGVVIVWIAANLALVYVGLRAFDPQPFTWLIEGINIASLIMTSMVLITQNRQNRVAEQRRHLELQFDMLIEQKVSKILSMLEELRRDLPTVRTVYDPEVEVMKQPADPDQVLTTLDQMLGEDNQSEEKPNSPS